MGISYRIILCWMMYLCLWTTNIQIAHSESLLLTDHHGESGAAWGLKQCDSCHLLNMIHSGAKSELRYLVQSKGYQSCTSCHGENDIESTLDTRQCKICHNAEELPLIPQTSGYRSHSFFSNGPDTLKDSDCVICHEASNMDGTFDPKQDLTPFLDASGTSQYANSVQEFCLRCHNREHQQPGYPISAEDYRDPVISMSNNYRYIDMHGEPRGSGQRTYAGLRQGYRYGTQVACTDCHAMHGTHNKKLLIDNSLVGVSGLQQSLRKLSIPIAIHNGNTAQLCVLCHAMTNMVEQGDLDTGIGLTGVHSIEGNCGTCHVHGMAVQTGL